MLNIRWLLLFPSLILFLYVSLSVAGKILLLQAETQKNQNPALAQGLYEKSLTVFPFDQGQWTVALTGLNELRLPLPEALVRKASFFNREDPYLLSLLAYNLEQQNERTSALELYQRLITLNPTNPLPYLKLSLFSAQANRDQQAVDYLLQAAKWRIQEQSQQYPGLAFQYVPQVTLPPENHSLNQAYLDYLMTIDPYQLSQADPPRLAQTLYMLGLLAHQHNQPDLVVPFWESALYAAPQWGWFHVELANLYLAQAKQEKAQQQISYCLQFSYANEACQQYQQNSLQPNKPQPIGFLENTIRQGI